MSNETPDPTQKDMLNVRLPAWAKAAHQRKADRAGDTLSRQVRSVLCASALGIIAAEKRAEAEPAPTNDPAPVPAGTIAGA